MPLLHRFRLSLPDTLFELQLELLHLAQCALWVQRAGRPVGLPLLNGGTHLVQGQDRSTSTVRSEGGKT